MPWGCIIYISMARDDGGEPEADMLPDERAVIAEREEDLDELDADEFLTAAELAAKLGIERTD
jgi:hypothetical protein